MKVKKVISWVLVCVGLCAAAEAQGTAPIEDARRHVAPDLGFSVAVPENWTCVPGGPHGYKCRPKEGDGAFESFSVLVSDPVQKELTPHEVDQFVQGSMAGMREQGWQTSQSTVEGTAVPLPGFSRFSYRAGAPAQGLACIMVGYIGRDPLRREVVFMHFAQGPAEPEHFKSFVASFRWTGNVPRPLNGVGTLNATLAVSMTLVLASVGWVINKAKGRVVVNLWKVAVVLLVVGGVGLSALWVPRIPKSLSPFDQGQVFGYAILGPLLWPALFALWRARALDRRRASEGTR